MHKTYDEISAVKQLQHYLSVISEVYIAQSGVYDETTKKSVIDFQKNNSLNANGIVDFDTHEKIYSKYKEETIRKKAPSKTVFPIKIGDFGDDIYVINEMMIRVMDSLNLFHSLRSSSIYNESSFNVFQELRKLFNMESCDFDELFYYFLKNEYDFIIKTE